METLVYAWGICWLINIPILMVREFPGLFGSLGAFVFGIVGPLYTIPALWWTWHGE